MNIFMKTGACKGSAFRIVLSLILIFVLSPVRYPAEGAENEDRSEILVIGSSSVISGNVASARQKAISDALDKGLEIYLTRFLGSQRMINNFTRLINEVVPVSEEMVEHFNILAEENNGKHYKLLVRIKVNENLMSEELSRLGIILPDIPAIRVLFLVSQEDTLHGDVAYWWNAPDKNNPLTSTELILFRVFQDRGFDPVNRLSRVPEEEYSEDMRDLELTDEKAIEWGKLFGVDMVITGISEIIQDDMVSIALKVLDVKEEIVIGEDSQIESVHQYDNDREQIMDTLARAVNSIANRLTPAIIESFEEAEQEISIIEIELRGLRNFSQLNAFMEFFKSGIEGVESVIQTSVKRNLINLSVVFSGKRDTFFNRVKSHERFPVFADFRQKEGGGFVIEIK
jgi:hypothetical protein